MKYTVFYYAKALQKIDHQQSDKGKDDAYDALGVDLLLEKNRGHQQGEQYGTALIQGVELYGIQISCSLGFEKGISKKTYCHNQNVIPNGTDDSQRMTGDRAVFFIGLSYDQIGRKKRDRCEYIGVKIKGGVGCALG